MEVILATIRNIKKLLEDGVEWPSELKTDTVYSRLHDDHDGEFLGSLEIGFSRDGDAWVSVIGDPGVPLRFRSGFGGGQSLRVSHALRILALAIKLDNEERPIQRPQL